MFRLSFYHVENRPPPLEFPRLISPCGNADQDFTAAMDAVNVDLDEMRVTGIAATSAFDARTPWFLLGTELDGPGFLDQRYYRAANRFDVPSLFDAQNIHRIFVGAAVL